MPSGQGSPPLPRRAPQHQRQDVGHDHLAVIRIEGMHCHKCEQSIQKALQGNAEGAHGGEGAVENGGVDFTTHQVQRGEEIEAAGPNGVIVSQGGTANGYALYLKDGKPAFAVRAGRQLTTIMGKVALAKGHSSLEATLGTGGEIKLSIDGKVVASGRAPGLIERQPARGLSVGRGGDAPVGDFEGQYPLSGKIQNVQLKF